MILFFKIFLTIILFRTLNIYRLSKLVEFFHLSQDPFKMKDLKDLSLQEKIGQLFIIRVKGLELTDETKKMIREDKIGNFVIFANNYQNITQISKLIDDIYQEVISSTGIMPFIAIDQEGGNTVRIKDKSTYYPGPMTISATELSNAKEIGHMMGKHLISLGININFAPLLDINNNPENPVINTRSFSDQIDIVNKYGLEMIKAMQEEGIIASGKHFPGHGDTEVDSHLGLPILNFDKKRIYSMELKPFKEAINFGVKNIMTAHIIFKEIDKENPATISKEIMTGILRKELNYNGLITSDSMDMKAISNGITTPVGVVKGLKAGIDIVCVLKKKSIYDSLDKVKQAINDDFFTMEEIDEKVKRILKHKKELYSEMKYKYFKNKKKLEIFKDNKYEKKIQNIVDSSLTFVNGKKLIIKGKTVVYWCQQLPYHNAEDIKSEDLSALFKKEIPIIDTLEYMQNVYSQELIDKSQDYETVIFLSFNAFHYPNQVIMINNLNKICNNFFVISMRNPYDYLKLDKNINYYTLYESTPNSKRTIIKFLKGEIEAKGKLPIILNHI